MSEEREWTPSQLFAIGSRADDLLLSAGAGSGKTATLTERVIRLVCDEENGVDISRMLIVTFTKAAAEELKDRVRKALSDRIRNDPSSRRLEHQMVALSSADISTISSFNLKLIKPYFSELGLPPSFAVADEDEIKVIKAKIMADTLDDFFDGGDDAFCTLADAISSSRDEKSMNAAILSLVERLTSKGFGPEQLGAWADELEASSERDFFDSPHGKIILDFTSSFADHIRRIFSALDEKMRGQEEVYKKYGELSSALVDFSWRLCRAVEDRSYASIKSVISSFEMPKLKGGVSAKNKTDESVAFMVQKNIFADRLDGTFRPLFAYAPEQIREVQLGVAAVTREISKIADEFRRRFAAEKKERGIVDYEDIELFAKQICVSPDGTPTDAARLIAKDYDCIFIDEYQDTNRIQDAVFSALAEGMPRFMVGDVKQSIYDFRGAEPSIFVSYRDTMSAVSPGCDVPEGGRHTLFMSENFRSDSTVIDFVNLISEYIFPGTPTPFEEGDRLIFSRKQPDGYREVPVDVVIVDDPLYNSRKVKKTDRPNVEAEYIAERISALLASGVRGDGSPIKEGDIAILMRSATDAGDYEEALKRRGIRVADRAREDFFEQKEILLAVSLLNAIDNPLRDIPLAALLKSPIFRFSVEELIKIRLGNTDTPLWFCVSDYANGGADDTIRKKCAEAVKFIESSRRRARRTDAATLINDLFDELSLYSLTDGDEPDGRRALSIRDNLTSFYEMARKYESSSFGGLYGFLSYIEKMSEKSVGSEAPQSKDSVSILTIHKSKGLEFPVCFLAKCSSALNMKDASASLLFDADLGPALKLRDPTGLVLCENPLRDALARKIRYDLVCQEMRTLYVALTRAEERLIVCITTNKPDDTILGADIARRMRSDFSPNLISSYKDMILPAVLGAGDSPYFNVVTARKDEIGFTEYRRKKADGAEEETKDLVSLYRERFAFEYPRSHLAGVPAKVTVSKLSPSLLDDADDEGAAPGFGEHRKESEGRPMPRLRISEEGEAPSPAERGSATHAFLQFCDFDALLKDGFAAERDRLASLGFIPKRWAALVDEEMIERFTSSALFDEIANASEVRREFRFNVLLPAWRFTADPELASRLRESGTDITVQGVTDIIFRTKDGELVLADYKTDRMSDAELSRPSVAKAHLRERHRTQLLYYKAACEKIFGEDIGRVVVFSLALGDSVDIF